MRHVALWWLMIVFGLPFVGAWALTLEPELRPAGRVNKGELIEPPLRVGATRGWVFAIPAAEGCGDECTRTVRKAERVRRALGEDARRVQPPLLCSADDNNPPCAGLLAETNGTLLVVDPMGYAVLRYRAGFSPFDLLDDMERLMRISRHWRTNATR